jgi:hypothetical protein
VEGGVGAAAVEEVCAAGDAVGVVAEEVGAAARDAAGDAAGVATEEVSSAAESGGTAGVLPAAAEMAIGRMAGLGEVFAGGKVAGSEGGVTAA